MLEGNLLLLVIAGAVILIILAATLGKIHPFLSILTVTILTGLVVGMPPDKVLESIQAGFGNILGNIGLVVVLGSIIGVFLDKSGGAWKLAQAMLHATGQQRLPLTVATLGAIVSIPVFCDSGFIILIGLVKSLAKRAAIAQPILALALAGGLYTTHTLVPPTPGPIAVTGNLGMNEHLGIVILLGLLLSIPAVLIAYFGALFFGKNISVQTTDTAQASPEESPLALWKVILPIFLPILLITLASVFKIIAPNHHFGKWIQFIGNPVIALLLSLLPVLLLLPKRNKRTTMLQWTSEAILQAGPILLLTGAGGAFGYLLKATPLSDWAASWADNDDLPGALFLVVGFALAAFLKTAQGSTTSALVISSSILAPLAGMVGFNDPIALSLLIAAIGAGGMVVSHVNDSYFWVVSQFSGINTRDTLRSFTLMTGLQGVGILLFVLLGYWLLT